MAKYAGVDMSAHQPPSRIDYKALKLAKIDGYTVKFAMLRFAYATSKDAAFDEHYKGCKAAGIHVGVYHWLRADTPAEARREAQWLVEQLSGYSIDYPVALDFEDEELFAKGYTKAQYTAIVNAFMGVLTAENYYVVLYTNPDTLRNRLTASVRSKYDIWLAHWTTQPADYGQTMWQYTALGTAEEVAKGWALTVGKVDGVSCPIDVNWAYVGYAAKIRKLGKNKPFVRYKLTASKTVTSDQLKAAEGQLRALGFTTSVSKTD